MKWDKLENSIKRTLGKREINPSGAAWEKLSVQLGHKEEKKSITKRWWVGIAASFLAGLLVATYFFKEEKTVQIKQPSIAVQNKPDTTSIHGKEKSTAQPLFNTKAESQLVEVKQKDMPATSIVTSNDKETKKSLKQRSTDEIPIKLIESIGEERPQTPVLATVNSIKPESKDQLVEQTSHRILKKLEEIDEHYEVTDAEINQLIKEAQLSIQTKSILTEGSNKVSAQALLNGVEQELDQSFRERVFEAVQKGLQQVRTAVANRNF